jgi:hypothetical protein
MRRSDDLNNKSRFVYILSWVVAGVAVGLAKKSGRIEAKAQLAEAAEKRHDDNIYKNFEIKEGLVDIDDIED